MRIGQIDHLIEAKRNDHGLILSATVKHYSPIPPIKCSVQIRLIEIILIHPSCLVHPEDIPLSYLPLDPNLPYRILNLTISTATPISIIFLASANPMTLLIEKIPQRIKRHLSVPWEIVTAIRTIMEFDTQLILVEFGIGLLFG